MTDINLAKMAENFDMTGDVIASTVMNCIETDNFSVLNANDNGDGDFTPPPLQNENNEASISASILDDKQIEAECTDLNYQVVLAANKCKEEKFLPKMDIISKETHFMVIPDDPKELDNFIKIGAAAVDAAKNILNKHNISVKEYQALHQKAKGQAFVVLNAALKLSVAINNLKTYKGSRSDLYPDQCRNKKQVLWEDFGLTQKQARRFASLTVDAVDKEKKFANDNDEIPTITHALTFVKKSKPPKEETRDSSANDDNMQNNVTTPNGKYDIIYVDFNKFDENFDLSQVANDNALIYMWANKSQLETAINIMNARNFEYIDCSVFIREKSEKGGKYFQDMHSMLLVGKKGDFKPPFTYKDYSVVYEQQIGENNGYAYYESSIKRMYPDTTILNLINMEEKQVSPEEIQNAE